MQRLRPLSHSYIALKTINLFTSLTRYEVVFSPIFAIGHGLPFLSRWAGCSYPEVPFIWGDPRIKPLNVPTRVTSP